MIDDALQAALSKRRLEDALRARGWPQRAAVRAAGEVWRRHPYLRTAPLERLVKVAAREFGGGRD